MHDTSVKPGDRVRAIGRHWLRPHAYGVISAIEPNRGEYMYLVEFDQVGKGIEGKFLYMDWLSFDVIEGGGAHEQSRFSTVVSNAA